MSRSTYKTKAKKSWSSDVVEHRNRNSFASRGSATLNRSDNMLYDASQQDSVASEKNNCSNATFPITPTSSQDDETAKEASSPAIAHVPGRFARAAPQRRAPPSKTKSMSAISGSFRGLTRSRSSRFSTKCEDQNKPWREDEQSKEEVADLRRTLIRTSSLKGTVLSEPTKKRSSKASNFLDEDWSIKDHRESEQKSKKSSSHNDHDIDVKGSRSFDDLWDESERSTEEPDVTSPLAKAAPAKRGVSRHKSMPSTVATDRINSRIQQIREAKAARAADLAKHSQANDKAESSSVGPPRLPQRLRKALKQQESQDETEEKKEQMQDDILKTPKPEMGREVDTSKVESNNEKDGNKSRFPTGAKAPPNTPTTPGLLSSVSTVAADSPGQATERKDHPLKHPRRNGPPKIPRRLSRQDGEKTKDGKKKKTKNKDNKDETKPAYKDKDEEIASLAKQLDRVTFLQKRQFDQLSSLKKMLLASRAKEKEHLKTNVAITKSLEERDSQVSALEKQVHELEKTLQGQEKDFLTAASVSALASTVDEVSDKRAVVEKADSSLLEEKDARIAELERQLEEIQATSQEQKTQMKNAVEIAETKVRRKAEMQAKLHDEMEEMRQQLTTAHTTIDNLEEERNFSRAKLSELEERVAQKGGLSDTDTELMERAAEISNLSAKLSTMDGKVQERDNKIFKLEEELKGVNDLVKQLSDAFVGEDEQLKVNQGLLMESASSPSQTSSLLLMTMLNMLDAMKTRLSVLQQERDDMNAKAADRGIQLAESHIRVDKLRAELRRMRQERERSRAAGGPGRGSGGRGRGSGGQPAPGRQGQSTTMRPRHASHNAAQAPQVQGVQGNRWSTDAERTPPPKQTGRTTSGEISKNSRTAPGQAPLSEPPQKSRFFNFIKGNLTQEAEQSGGTSTQESGSQPFIVST